RIRVGNGTAVALDSIFIEALPVPVINLVTDTILCGDQFITLNPGYPLSLCQWSTGQVGPFIVVDTNTLFNGYGERVIELKVTNVSRCWAESETTINFVDCTNIGELIHPDLQIYPNPSNGKFTVLMNQFELKKITLSIYDLAGQVVIERDEVLPNEANVRTDVDLTRKEPGCYLLVIKGKEFVFTKIVLIK
ncbi:MAG: T9SS type A sorting domain-containing protein, partial [Bacteroidales bacterium]